MYGILHFWVAVHTVLGVIYGCQVGRWPSFRWPKHVFGAQTCVWRLLDTGYGCSTSQTPQIHPLPGLRVHLAILGGVIFFYTEYDIDTYMIYIIHIILYRDVALEQRTPHNGLIIRARLSWRHQMPAIRRTKKYLYEPARARGSPAILVLSPAGRLKI
jgi:hypothetical protein